MGVVLCVGFILGVGAATRGPDLLASYLPRTIAGPSEPIEGEVVRKQRESDRLLLKIATAQGPMLVTFTQKVAELDLLLEPGDTVTLMTRGYATFVQDPTLERVKRQGSAPPSSESKGKTVR